ncbi:rhodopsin [Cryobacterium sp. MDB1-18-2]|uniref:Rhodopsin n=2 Tax=Bacteria TaxID=2 RepID=A0ABY2IKQ0_9MICO|nr:MULTISPECIES: bacteriorhodopsin [Cryobacterium]MEB0202672.1 bacteriorhodopsin [Cryobacterium sp. 5I3]TFC01951.1 rhodopsin [Cryobacterium sp. MDB2-33-2]TFC16742.1 rhodopsin [Cryobacterium glucosi]TFC29742.1 rhodopsin [Cryobacterium sp. MDB1-18-2]TFC41031.1 rhodopsin [Cryobacterium sp. MDB1-18-1]
MLVRSLAAPWEAGLSPAQYQLICYFVGMGALCFFVGFLRAWVTRGEVGARYRTAVVARLGIMSAMFLSYLVLLSGLLFGYTREGAEFVPNGLALLTFGVRYVEWSVAVPLVVIELLAVCVVLGGVARRIRLIAMAGGFFMVFLAYLGAIVASGGTDAAALVGWGIAAGVFWLATTALLASVVRRSLPVLTVDSAALLRSATILLLSSWAVYPIVYAMPLVGSGGTLVVVMQIMLTVADIVAKIWFGGVLHRVAKLRTAEDVRAGRDVHPEAIWISSVKQSDAGKPREVYLAAGAAVHVRRPQPPTSTAAPTSQPELFADPQPELFADLEP